MTRDDVLEMAGEIATFASIEELERFAALVAERTRQEISKEEAKDRRDYLRAMSPG